MVRKLLKIADSTTFFQSTTLCMQPALKKSLFEVLAALIMNNSLVESDAMLFVRTPILYLPICKMTLIKNSPPESMSAKGKCI
jgi:hypothetical protein